MTYQDLKDGMILTLREGKKFMVFKDWVYEFEENKVSGGYKFIHWGKTFQWDRDELKMFRGLDSSDVMKVEYMGEIILERVEYVSFMDAVNSGKKFKYKDWVEYHICTEALKILGNMNEATEKMNEVAWVIEQ